MELYTEKALEVMEEAEKISNELEHSYIGSEHILVGLLRVEDTAATDILKKNGVEISKVMELIDTLVSPVGKVALKEKELLTPRVQNMLLTAADYAKITKDKKVGTEHILLALIKERDSVATRLLNTIGVDLRNIYAEVLETIGISASEFREEIAAAFGDPRAQKSGN